ncbi:MAG: vWA domain-containing protein [Planctomycetota bacterium]
MVGPMAGLAPDEAASLPSIAPDGERYEGGEDNPWRRAIDAPLSTFSVDVDTASYANVRRMLLQWGQRPPREAVRIEEFINAFDYRYPVPAADAAHPFSVTVDAANAPWATEHRLVRIGLQGHELSIDERPAANLVFLVDASGSMRNPAKMPLVKASLRMLLSQLGPSDRVAIVTYAGGAQLVLDSTPVTDTGRAAIEAAIDGLSAGGSTNGEGGIRLAYRVAAASMIPGGANRVVLCTDGDFNVGVSGPDELQRLVEQQRRTGVFLNVVGFGTGNLRDDAMERLSNHGNGVASYIDSLPEAEKVFVRGAVGSLVTIARDVKVQVDFNPGRVQAYRLIGYTNRALRDQDFNDDRVDAGEIGAGHSVTALYEIVPVGVAMPDRVDGSKYRRPAEEAGEAEAASDLLDSPELLTVRVRYKPPAGGESVRFDTPFTDAGTGLAESSPDFRFAAAVAGFGMLLRQSPHAGTLDWAMVRQLAEPGLVEDPFGDRREFLALVRAAEVVGD